MQDVEYMAKDDHIKFKSTNYKAISEEKVTRTVRESLIKNKLVILPVEQDHSREGTLSTVNVKYKIIDIESGENEVIVSSGTGVDTQDKGVGKAMTYAYKYLLLRTFAIPTGEDPDKISSAETDEREQQPQRRKPSNSQAKEPSKDVILAKFKTGGGTEEQFNAWYAKQLSAGVTNLQMDELLTRKLQENQNK